MAVGGELIRSEVAGAGKAAVPTPAAASVAATVFRPSDRPCGLKADQIASIGQIGACQGGCRLTHAASGCLFDASA